MKKPKPRTKPKFATQLRVKQLSTALNHWGGEIQKLRDAVRELQEKKPPQISPHIVDLAANTIRIESELKAVRERFVEHGARLLSLQNTINKNHEECSKGGSRLLDYDHNLDVRVKALESAALPRENTEVLLRLHG